MFCGISFFFEIIKKKTISAGEGNSITIQAHFDFITGPHPFLRNLPYGAEIKNKSMKTIIEKLKIKIIKILCNAIIQ